MVADGRKNSDRGEGPRAVLAGNWFKKALRSDEEYVAVTDTGTYVALMTRTEVISEVVLALSEA